MIISVCSQLIPWISILGVFFKVERLKIQVFSEGQETAQWLELQNSNPKTLGDKTGANVTFLLLFLLRLSSM